MTKNDVKNIILQEAVLDKVIDHVGKVLKNNKVKQLKQQLEDDDPEMAEAIEQLNQSYQKVADLWDDFLDD